MTKKIRPSCLSHPPEASKLVISQQLVCWGGSFCVLSIFLSAFLCGKHYMVVRYWYHSVKKTLIILLCLFQCIDLTLIMSHCWYLSLGSTSDRKEMWLKNINIERNDLCINKYDNIYSALLASNIHLKPQNMSYLNCW